MGVAWARAENRLRFQLIRTDIDGQAKFSQVRLYYYDKWDQHVDSWLGMLCEYNIISHASAFSIPPHPLKVVTLFAHSTSFHFSSTCHFFFNRATEGTEGGSEGGEGGREGKEGMEGREGGREGGEGGDGGRKGGRGGREGGRVGGR